MTERDLTKPVWFTSISFSYFNRAMVLFESFKKHQPDWHSVLVLTDLPPKGFDISALDGSYDEIIWTHKLPWPNFESWIFKHNVIEACTAIKGRVLDLLLEAGYPRVYYFDPDTVIFQPLDLIQQELDGHNILLTPHQLCPEKSENGVMDNEISSLIHGTYNLGFLGVNQTDEGRAFGKWWNDRLRKFCFDDKPRGLFVDQKWCDLVPAYFDGVKISRQPGLNVASWNLSNRQLGYEDGQIFVNGAPLVFYHFTKLGPIGDVMTARYAAGSQAISDMWLWYKSRIEAYTRDDIPEKYWAFGKFKNGQPIEDSMRQSYRLQHNSDTYPRPFLVGEGTYYNALGLG